MVVFIFLQGWRGTLIPAFAVAAFPVMRAVRILKPAVDLCFPVSGEGLFRGFMEKH